MSAHTPGRLTVGGIKIFGAEMSAFVESDASEAQAMVNAARLAACWNACEGIANPAGVSDAIAALRDFANEHDAWLDAMERQTFDDPLTDAREAARKAIASLEGRAE